MTDVALVPISWIRTVAAVFAIAIAGVFFLGRCSAPVRKGLPPAEQQLVERHEASSAVDTATVNRLEREKASARGRELAAARGRRAAEDSGRADRRRADSLEAVAKAAQTSADSAAAWQQAYYQRTGEAEDLQLALADAKMETAEVRVQLAAADSQVEVWRGRALRADTVIARLLPLAESAGDRCRILGPIRCPSRKQTAIAAVVATIAVMSGRVRLPR
jgi:hypothetical protein